MSNLVSVRWIKKKAPYNVGEICGLAPDVAKAEVKLKRAVLVNVAEKSDKETGKSSKKSSKKKKTSARRRIHS